MGTALEPVTGSGDWPAWTARVANCCFDSDMVGSLIGGWGGGGFWLVDASRAGCGPRSRTKRPESSSDPGRLASRSVASSAFASQEPHGRVRSTYTWP